MHLSLISWSRTVSRRVPAAQRRRLRPLAALACVPAVVLASACESESVVDVTVEPAYAVAASSVTVSPAEATVLVGQSIRFRATRVNSSGDRVSVSVTWSTSNSSIATVSTNGGAGGRAPGRVTITARSSTYGSGTATLTVRAVPVLRNVTVTPPSVTVIAGASTQLSAVGKDQTGAPMSGVTFTWVSTRPGTATVDGSGRVTGVEAGTTQIVARSGAYADSTTVTVIAPPPSKGIWIGKTELNTIPMSGSRWTGAGELKTTADAAWTLQPLEVQDQVFNAQVMAGALVFARLYPDPDAEQYRSKVAQAFRQIVALPLLDTAEVTFPSRNLGAYAIAADLINLRGYDTSLDKRFRAWLRRALDAHYTGGGGAPTIRVAAWERPNNIGAYSRFSLAAASAYLGDRSTLGRIAVVMRRWLGDTRVKHDFVWYGAQNTWQMNPSDSATWVGINRKGATRNGNDFDGLQPEEQYRGVPGRYDPARFPNDYSLVRYNEVALEAHLAAALILHRAGYTDLIDASDQAMLRAAKWIRRASDRNAARGYRYFTGNREAARPLINYFYRSAGLPESRTRDQLWGRAFGFAWTYWTHGGRSIR